MGFWRLNTNSEQLHRTQNPALNPVSIFTMAEKNQYQLVNSEVKMADKSQLFSILLTATLASILVVIDF